VFEPHQRPLVSFEQETLPLLLSTGWSMNAFERDVTIEVN